MCRLDFLQHSVPSGNAKLPKGWGLLAAGLMALALVQPASAALIVSGDTNILGDVDRNAANRQFLLNLAGDGIVVLHPGPTVGFITDDVSGVLGDAAVAHFALTPDAVVTAADLVGASLYISYINATGWTDAEAMLLRGFVIGGGHVLLAGDNAGFPVANAATNALSQAIGSDLSILGDDLSSGVRGTATILAANAFTAGTEGLEYISASRVIGGAGLYGAGDNTIVGFDTLTAVPEPSTWALMIAGFGAVGAMMRGQGRQSRRNPGLAPLGAG